MARDLDAMRAWLIERISKALKVKGRMVNWTPFVGPRVVEFKV